MDREFQRLSLLNSQNVDRLVGDAETKAYWQSLSDAADRLAKYTQTTKDIPKLTSGYAANIMFTALPVGSVIEVRNAFLDKNNGKWIKGITRSNGRGNPVVWTHFEDSQGNKLSRTQGSANYVGEDNWNTRIVNDSNSTQLRIIRYGSK